MDLFYLHAGHQVSWYVMLGCLSTDSQFPSDLRFGQAVLLTGRAKNRRRRTPESEFLEGAVAEFSRSQNVTSRKASAILSNDPKGENMTFHTIEMPRKQ
jgi:hypothetical protein